VTNMGNMFSGASAMSDCHKASIGHSDGHGHGPSAAFGLLQEKDAWGNLAYCP